MENKEEIQKKEAFYYNDESTNLLVDLHKNIIEEKDREKEFNSKQIIIDDINKKKQKDIDSYNIEESIKKNNMIINLHTYDTAEKNKENYIPISKEQIMRENIKYLTDFSLFEFNKCTSEYDVYMWRKQYTPFFPDLTNKELAKADWLNLKTHKENYNK